MKNAVQRRQKKPRKFRCTQCLNWYFQRQSLWRHVHEVHGPVMYLYCKRCAYKATRGDTMRRHYRGLHPEVMEEAETIQPQVERLERSDTEVMALVTAG